MTDGRVKEVCCCQSSIEWDPEIRKSAIQHENWLVRHKVCHDLWEKLLLSGAEKDD